MNAPQFTPGPWQWFPSVSKERSAIIDTAIGVDSTNGTIIAEVTRGAQFHANADLLAAAPELYEALDELHLKAVIGTDDERHAALNKAWAALSKARGQA